MTQIDRAIRSAVKPTTALAPGLLADLMRSRTELLTENALFRQQLIVLRRCAKRPKIRRHERSVMVVLAASYPAFKATRMEPATAMRTYE